MSDRPIFSDDENALEKLKEKAEILRESQEEMVKANKYWRKNGTMKGYGGLTDEQARQWDNKILTGYSWEKQPYPAYHLQNNNRNLRRIEGRVKSLERENAYQAEDHRYDAAKYGFEVCENKEDMRLQLFFQSKPKEEVRTELKRNGFHWSPANDCWQRLLNNNARYALKYIIRQMEQQRGGMEM